LNSVVKKQNLKVLSFYTEDEKEKQELINLSLNDEENKLKFKKYIADPRRNLFDILMDFKTVKLPIEVFLEIMPRLQPRYYSIASSSSLYPNSVHLLVAVVRYKTSLKAINGVCSNYISNLEIGSSAYIFVRKSTFHLPEDTLKPVIMIGPGTGYAPMRGFLQVNIKHKKQEKIVSPWKRKKIGKITFIFWMQKPKRRFHL
jgi:NADPH-ferrihemoprotein reductase